MPISKVRKKKSKKKGPTPKSDGLSPRKIAKMIAFLEAAEQSYTEEANKKNEEN